MAKTINISSYKNKSKKHKGIHAKSKMSALKSSKNYFKKYKGQGK